MFTLKKQILIFFALCLTLSATATAHPGGTDARGGHHVSGTGEYHFHHGYPAHQHTGGVCPYDFDDKTGENSGSSSGNSSSSSSNSSGTGKLYYHDGYPPHQHAVGQCPYDYIDESSGSSASSSEEEPPDIILIALAICLGLALFIKLTVTVVRNRKREAEERRLDAIRQQAEREELAKKMEREAEERRLLAARLQAEHDDLITKYSGKTRTQIAVACGMSPELYIDENDFPHDKFTGDMPDRCTVYVASNASVYHRNPRCRQAFLSPVNITKVRHLNPCRYCAPDRINLDWYSAYKETIRLMRKHGIEPLPETYSAQLP